MDLETYWKAMRAAYVHMLRADLRNEQAPSVQHHAEAVAARRQYNSTKARYIQAHARVDSTSTVTVTSVPSEQEAS